MKRLQHLISILLVLVMVVGTLPVEALAASAGITGVLHTGSATHINPLYPDAAAPEIPELPDAGVWNTEEPTACATVEEAAVVLRDAMENRQETVQFIYERCESVDAIGTLFTEILNAALAHTGVPTEGDYLVWQYGGVSVRYTYYSNSDGSVYDITFIYSLSYYTTAEQEAAMNTAVADLLGELALADKTDYEKICGIYDYICDNVVYDYEHLELGIEYPLMFTAYAALINGTSVCQGYANLFYRLALELGVDNRIVVGDAGGPHSWNLVELDGSYYYLDATWDAPRAAAGIPYEYFLLGSSNFCADHTPESEFLGEYAVDTEDYVPGSSIPGEPGAVTASGTCGEGLTWTLTENGFLTISGTGEMADSIWESDIPWYNDRDSIRVVIVENGVERICTRAFAFCTNLLSVSLPETLKSIGSSAFYCCENIESITIPGSVTDIGDEVFHGCKKLSSIEIPNSVTGIGYGLFYGCDSLVSVTLPEGTTEIGINMFYFCESLTEIKIPNSVTSIGNDAFRGCESLVSIDIPAGVTYIGDSVFASCYKLTGIHVDSSNQQYCSVDGVLFSKDMKRLICHPGARVYAETYVIPSGVVAIEKRAFDSCRFLFGVTIPDSVVYIGEEAFHFCYYLGSVAIPEGVTTISAGTFRECWGLEEVYIPSTVTRIDARAFYGCTGEVTIGSAGLKNVYYTGTEEQWNAIEIGSENAPLLSAKRTCSGTGAAIPEVPNIVISSGTCGQNLTWTVTNRGVLTISGTGAMVDNTVQYISSAEMPWYSYLPHISEVVIEKGVTGIGACAFAGCYNLTRVTMPAGLVSIGRFAFAECTGLTDIVIPDGVTSISEGAFQFSSNLATITIPASVTIIDIAAFNGCSALKTVYYGGSKAQWAEVYINNNANDYLTGAEIIFAIEDPTLPEDAIAAGTCGENLTWVLTEDGVLTISGTGAMTDFNWEAAPWDDYLNQIRSLVIENGVTTIGSTAFDHCLLLRSVSIAESVLSIGAQAFSDCISLTEIFVPVNVTSIGSGAFSLCTSLVAITVDGNNGSFCSVDGVLFNKVKDMLIAYPQGKNAAEYEIPDSVTIIEEYAFINCADLVTLTIPGGVTRIGWGAFHNCTALTTVRYGGTEAQWSKVEIGDSNDPLLNAEITYLYGHSHTEEIIPGKAATCTEPGLSEGKKCSTCGEIIVTQTEIPALGHNMKETSAAVAPTCEKAGKTAVLTCANNCGKTEGGEEVAATGHDMKETSAAVAPTCEKAGKTAVLTCANNCGKTEGGEEVAALGHDFDNGTVTKEPTCTEAGEKTYKCKREGCTESKSEAVAALGHVDENKDNKCDRCGTVLCTDESHTEETIPGKAATCTEDGLTDGKKCSACGKVLAEQEVIPALGHDYDDGTVTKEPTTTEKGVKTYTCQREGCGDSYTEEIPMIEVEVKLDAPTVKTSNIASSGKIKVSWSKVEGAEKYEIWASTSKNGTYTKLGTVTKTSVTHSTAKAGKTYYYKIRAIAGDVKGEFSEPVGRTCDLARPVVKTTNVASTGKIKISWNKVDGAVKYEVYRATSENGKYTLLTTTTKTSVTNTKTEAGKTYYYKVKAIAKSNAANSAASTAVGRTCDLARPTVTVKLNSKGKPVISWKKVTSAVKYAIYRATSENGKYTLIGTTTKTSVTNSKAEAGVTYYYKVRAIAKNSAANSAYSTVAHITAK